MQAAKRQFHVGDLTFDTPQIVPSFSSRGFPDVKKIIDVTKEYISEQTLISAFDLYYRKIPLKNWNFTDLVFVDSGGYEVSQEFDLSDYKFEVSPLSELIPDKKILKKIWQNYWTEEKHLKALHDLSMPSSTVLVSYDNPRQRRVKTTTQISRAKKLASAFPNVAIDLLLKADKKANGMANSGFVTVDQIARHIEEIAKFDILGVTEKELGRSIRERVEKVYHIRQLLTENAVDMPLHIFGSLDPISSYLYFLAGADIFDGLTWLRFAYKNDLAIYRHNYAALELDRGHTEAVVNSFIHQRNYDCLVSMQVRMQQFLNVGNLKVFGAHHALLKECMDQVIKPRGVT